MTVDQTHPLRPGVNQWGNDEDPGAQKQIDLEQGPDDEMEVEEDDDRERFKEEMSEADNDKFPDLERDVSNLLFDPDRVTGTDTTHAEEVMVHSIRTLAEVMESQGLKTLARQFDEARKELPAGDHARETMFVLARTFSLAHGVKTGWLATPEGSGGAI